MIDAQLILSQARQGAAPSTWRIFAMRKDLIGTLFSSDPDPLIVFTPEAVIQYIHEKKPLTVIEFATLSKIELKVDPAIVALSQSGVWLHLHSLNGEKARWPELVSLGNNDLTREVVQYFIEAHARYKTLHSNMTIEND